MLFRKFELVSSGVRKSLAHAPAVVTEVSWPSFAVRLSQYIRPSHTQVELTHVGSNKHPLWKGIIREIFIEHCKVLDLRKPVELRSG